MELTDIKGIGPAKLTKLAGLGIKTVSDLIYHFPFRYIDRKRNLKVIDLFLIDHENYHCIGTIEKISVVRISKGRQITNAILADDTGKITITWFNNPYIVVNFHAGDKIILSGKPDGKKLINPKIRKVNSDDDIERFSIIQPVYSETKGLNSQQINTFVRDCIKNFIEKIKDSLDESIRKKENLIDLNRALYQIHFPNNQIEIDESRKRLAFDEIFRILTLVKAKKKALQKYEAPKILIDTEIEMELIRDLSFKLTESQEISLKEIYEDIEIGIPMHRLLNGDVGSGKTIVAALTAAQILANKQQVIFLAPTAVLAKQHHEFLVDFFKDFDEKLKIHLVTSNTRTEIKKLERELSNDNSFELFIGTHALLFHFELFKNVGFVVIDEQHKFGVAQRELLEQFSIIQDDGKRKIPHVLSMSATPIPRTLALTLYGDLDVSTLKKPEERKKITTRCIENEDIAQKMYTWVRSEISDKKAQVYVVCPLIEESEKLDTKSVLEEYSNLQKIFPKYKVALLHGKLKAKEKDEILSAFIKGEIDILVSTSVIEVGINNPNATTMIIEGAERFGLAQLHQIRGRVGRSEKQSYCLLKATNYSQNERLKYFAENNDGFALAEYDLISRGPGELYGNTQSGLPKLKIANLFDIEFIKKVKEYVI